MSAAGVVLLGGVAVIGCVAAGRRAVRPLTEPRTPEARSGGAADQPGLLPIGGPGAPGPSGGLVDRWSGALADAGVEGDPRRWARVAGGAAILATLVGAARGGPAGAVVVGGLAITVGLVVLRAAAGRGARRADARLPELLEHTGRDLRAGVDLVGALRRAAAEVGGLHGAEVATVVARVDGGASLPVALQGWAGAHPRRPVALAVGALEVAAEAGGARARAIEGVAATLRSRLAVADEARALAGQARSSAAVLVALPVVVTVLGALADPRHAGDLLGTPVGLACLVSAAVLDLAGGWWMHRIVGGDR